MITSDVLSVFSIIIELLRLPGKLRLAAVDIEDYEKRLVLTTKLFEKLESARNPSNSRGTWNTIILFDDQLEWIKLRLEGAETVVKRISRDNNGRLRLGLRATTSWLLAKNIDSYRNDLGHCVQEMIEIQKDLKRANEKLLAEYNYFDRAERRLSIAFLRRVENNWNRYSGDGIQISGCVGMVDVVPHSFERCLNSVSNTISTQDEDKFKIEANSDQLF